MDVKPLSPDEEFEMVKMAVEAQIGIDEKYKELAECGALLVITRHRTSLTHCGICCSLAHAHAHIHMHMHMHTHTHTCTHTHPLPADITMKSGQNEYTELPASLSPMRFASSLVRELLAQEDSECERVRAGEVCARECEQERDRDREHASVIERENRTHFLTCGQSGR